MCVPHTGLLFGLRPLGAGATAVTRSTADEHFRGVLIREAVDTGRFSPVFGAIGAIQPAIDTWSNGYVDAVYPSGSFAKGTANRSGTDLDLFISIRGDVPNTLEQIHSTLCNQLQARGLQPKRQNVSVGVTVNGLSLDLVPGRQLGVLGTDHNLFHKKSGYCRKTNVLHHINVVRASG